MLSMAIQKKRKHASTSAIHATTKLSNAIKKSRQESAFAQLTELRKQNNGNTLNHDILAMVNIHKDPVVTKSSLNYMLRKQIDAASKDVINAEQVTEAHGNYTYQVNMTEVMPIQVPVVEVHANAYHESVSENSVLSPLTGDSDTLVESPDNSFSQSTRDTTISKSGRLATINAKKKLFHRCTTIASHLYSEARDNALKEKKNIAKNTLKGIIKDVENEYKLCRGTLNRRTIKGRVSTGNLTGYHPNKTSPLYGMESLLVAIILHKDRYGENLKKANIIKLAQSMSKGTEYARRYNAHMKIKRPPSVRPQDEVACVGNKWYRNFSKRHPEHLVSKKLKVTDAKRRSFVTKDNFQSMYDSVYSTLVKAGAAKELDKEVMLDQSGNVVYNEEEMYGLPTKYIMTNPRNFIFVDETGCNTNQKTDGLIGGEQVLVSTDNTGTGRSGSTTDLRYTVLGFTNGLGEPVMCAVIFQSKQPIEKIPLIWKLGLDRTIEFRGDPNNADDINDNMENNSNMMGGPNCCVNGKTVPCYYGSSPNASITGKMLQEMLRQIDDSGVIDRTDGKTPVLLCDGHHSRYEEHFQTYLHNQETPWNCVVGVPYGTHVWQVADSAELNGCMKMELTKAKQEYRENVLDKKTDFCITDVIPLLNRSWEKSFARTANAKKAIEERGWGPLNYCLLRYYPFIENVARETFASMLPYEDEDGLYNIGQINVSGYCGELLEEIGMYLLQSNARVKARQEKLTATEEHSKKFKTLKEIFGSNIPIRSASMFQNNQSVMTTQICDAVKEKAAAKKAKTSSSAENKRKRELNAKNKYTKALAAFRINPDKLTGENLGAIIQNHAVIGDSPVKKTKAELVEQFERRQYSTMLHNLFGTTATTATCSANSDMTTEETCTLVMVEDRTSNSTTSTTSSESDCGVADTLNSNII